MTSPTDNEIIEAVARAIYAQNPHLYDPEGCGMLDLATLAARASLSVATPLITNRTQEAVLREMMEAYSITSWTVPQAIRQFAKQRGITLDGDGNG